MVTLSLPLSNSVPTYTPISKGSDSSPTSSSIELPSAHPASVQEDVLGVQSVKTVLPYWPEVVDVGSMSVQWMSSTGVVSPRCSMTKYLFPELLL